MRGKVVIEEEAAYRTWLAEQITYAQSVAQAGIGRREERLVAARTKIGAEDGSNLVSSDGAQAAGRGIVR